jgi:hypothetical protein
MIEVIWFKVIGVIRVMSYINYYYSVKKVKGDNG